MEPWSVADSILVGKGLDDDDVMMMMLILICNNMDGGWMTLPLNPIEFTCHHTLSPWFIFQKISMRSIIYMICLCGQYSNVCFICASMLNAFLWRIYHLFSFFARCFSKSRRIQTPTGLDLLQLWQAPLFSIVTDEVSTSYERVNFRSLFGCKLCQSVVEPCAIVTRSWWEKA